MRLGRRPLHAQHALLLRARSLHLASSLKALPDAGEAAASWDGRNALVLSILAFIRFIHHTQLRILLEAVKWIKLSLTIATKSNVAPSS